jgi:hypothetical protein
LVLANVFRAAPQSAASAGGTKEEVNLPIQGDDYLMLALVTFIVIGALLYFFVLA